jgi:hypothetical protein
MKSVEVFKPHSWTGKQVVSCQLYAPAALTLEIQHPVSTELEAVSGLHSQKKTLSSLPSNRTTVPQPTAHSLYQLRYWAFWKTQEQLQLRHFMLSDPLVNAKGATTEGVRVYDVTWVRKQRHVFSGGRSLRSACAPGSCPVASNHLPQVTGRCTVRPSAHGATQKKLIGHANYQPVTSELLPLQFNGMPGY